MISAAKSKRRIRLNMAVAAIGLLSVAKAEGRIHWCLITRLPDSPIISILRRTPPSTGASAAYTVGNADTFEGDGYTLAAGTTDLSGFDFYPINGTAATTFTNIQVNLYVWGTVNTTTTPSATTPAFSNLISHITGVATFASPGLQPGYIGLLGGTTPSTTGDFTLSTPLSIPSSTVGITINYQGSTDNGATYSSVQTLTSYIPYGVPPTVGASLFKWFLPKWCNRHRCD